MKVWVRDGVIITLCVRAKFIVLVSGSVWLSWVIFHSFLQLMLNTVNLIGNF